jgi:hypothetical protein
MLSLHKHLSLLCGIFKEDSLSISQLSFADSAVGSGTYAISRKAARWNPDNTGFLHSFQPQNAPGVDSAYKGNKYQESSLGVKRGLRVQGEILNISQL